MKNGGCTVGKTKTKIHIIIFILLYDVSVNKLLNTKQPKIFVLFKNS